MAGTLFVVATPIGNLEDITLRARRLLGEVDLVAAEDTRHTRKLLRHHGLRTATTSLYAQNEHLKTPTLLAKLASGVNIALVSDAGTPTISDPGGRLVAAAHDAGVRVVPVPGPSAMLAALSSSGFDTTRFRFEGFAPRKLGQLRSWLKKVALCEDAVIFFEAPHRIRRTLEELRTHIGERPIFVAREVTKLHEELVKGPTDFILNNLIHIKGEFTIVVSPTHDAPKTAVELDATSIYQLFCEMTENNDLSRREAIRKIAEELMWPTRKVYRLIEEVKQLPPKGGRFQID